MQIHTVCGKKDLAELGNTLIHEHVICTGPEFSREYASWLPEELVLDIACKKIRFAAERYGIRTIIDGTPQALGRNLELLRTVSERTGVNIIASTGFYFYNTFAIACLPEQRVADFLIGEITSGAIRPSMLKCAADSDGLPPHVRKMMRITALVQKATDLPVFIHSYAPGRTGTEALQLFMESGVSPSRIVVGHTADSNDLSYPLELLEKGCFISIDRISRSNALQKGTMALELIRKGFENKIFLAHDHICCKDSLMNQPPDSQGEPGGLDTISAVIMPMLQENGFGESTVENLLKKNLCALFAAS
ncbi:MAG: hypothetical protein J6S58_04430 [Lentisphaeria bacterium]|nr:hypothetical protein [Lentisphaeria bacterium]